MKITQSGLVKVSISVLFARLVQKPAFHALTLSQFLLTELTYQILYLRLQQEELMVVI
ncbi:hypothetical protein XSR1_980003 [Xenorhabdus szentirmaii DSM 16338]|uniref:Uncharacterized protein n=1 Tax=Xenorhabdus szentirmaii DSM 16338 TaxID=1427518 RepID=W1J4X9_9GAMM|nr:hypothetical protein XSR1_980003 [Xenorhabdus szentirmaii DSM 16338]